jgi:hypothetical protein
MKTAIAIALTLVAAAGIMAAAQANAPTKEAKCEDAMRAEMTARLRGEPEPPPFNVCASLTDAQWFTVNRHLEPLHNALTEARR